MLHQKEHHVHTGKRIFAMIYKKNNNNNYIANMLRIQNSWCGGRGESLAPILFFIGFYLD